MKKEKKPKKISAKEGVNQLLDLLKGGQSPDATKGDIAEVLKLLKEIKSKMATQADLTTKINELKTADDARHAAQIAALQRLEALISGGGSGSDTQPQIDIVQAVIGSLTLDTGTLDAAGTTPPTP